MSVHHPGYALPLDEARSVSLFHRVMRNPLVVGIMIVLILLLTGGPIVLLQPVVLPLLHWGFLEQWRFRRFFDYCTGAWMCLMVFYLEFCLGIRMLSFGHAGRFKPRSLILMNHRSHFDWMFFWGVLDRQGDLTTWKAVMKKMMRNVPLLGQAMQYQSQIFISRKWDADIKELEQKLFYLNGLEQPLQLLLFPEGGDLTPQSKLKSDQFADTHGLPRFEYCLHPRTRGLTYIMSAMRSGGLEAVYDITLAYPDTIAFTEFEFMKGIIPREIHFHIMEYAATSLPLDDAALAQWCQQRWSEKEQRLQRFYQHRCFTEESAPLTQSTAGHSPRHRLDDQNGTRAGARIGGGAGVSGVPSQPPSLKEVRRRKNVAILLNGFLFYFGCSALLYWLLYISWFVRLLMLMSGGFLLYQSYLAGGIDQWIMSHSQEKTERAVQFWRETSSSRDCCGRQ